MSAAIWISPYGKIYDVTTTHIDFVFTNPEKFGMTEEEIRETYKKHKEVLGTEGKAREEILLNVLNAGWIRGRYNRDGWHIQLKRLNGKAKNNIIDWLLTSDGTDKGKYTPLIIMPEMGSMCEVTVSDFLADKVASRKKKITKYCYPLHR